MAEQSAVATAGNGGTAAEPRVQAADRTIIEASIADPEQFATIFRRHAPEIQRYVTRRLGADAADDVVADTFLAAFRQRSSYDLSYPDARPWIYGIATNLIGRQRRAELRQYRALARAGAGEAGSAESEPFTDRVDATVAAAAARPQLAAALGRLSVSSRNALLLIAWGGLTYEQAAIALGVPVGTVRSQISRARERLRRYLAEAGISVSR